MRAFAWQIVFGSHVESPLEYRKLRAVAARTALLYIVGSALWIFFSDRAVGLFAPDRDTATHWSMYKGWGFAAVTGFLLYAGLRQQLGRWLAARRFGEAATAERLALESQISKIAATAPGAILSFRLSATGEQSFPYASARVEEVYGISAEDVMRDASLVFAVINDEDRQRILPAIEHSRSSHQPFHFEFRINNPNRGLVWAEVRLQPERQPDGSTLWHGFLHDITARRAAQDEAQRSADLLRAVVEGTTDAVFIKDLEGRYLLANEATSRFMGRPVAEILGRTDRELVDRGSAETIAAADREVISSGNAITAEEELVLGGNPITFMATKAPYRDRNGNVIGVIGVSRDITDRKNAERALAESEERLRLATRAAKLGTWDWDVTQDVILWSDAVWDSFGKHSGPSPVTFEDFKNSLHPDDRARVLQEIESALRLDDPYKTKFRVVQPEGTIAWVSSVGRVQRDAAGKPKRMVGIHIDITDREVAEEMQRTTELRYRTLFDYAPDGILIGDANSVYLDANPAMCRMLGYTREELIGLNATDIISADEAASIDETIEAVKRGADHHKEWRFRRKDGSLFPVEVQATRMPDGNLLGMVRDVTERKELEKQFLRAQRMESIGTLAGGIAHDLNNVLGPITLSLGVLNQRCKDAATRELLDVIRASATHGANMVRQVLSFGRGVEGQRIEVQLTTVVQDVEKIATDTFFKSIQVRARYPEDLWTVTGDPTQLHQVLLNLAVNARDAMPRGGTLTISAENVTLDEHSAGMTPGATAGPHVLLKVEDTGVGMTLDVVEKIFDPFYTTKEIGKGTGLGLSTSLAIVKSHQGFMQVESQPGEGSRFRVYLPAKPRPAMAMATTRTPDLPEGNGELILVIDDEVAARKITKQTLEAFGYRAIVALDGAEAVATFAARGSEIAVVITDMMMPQMDGVATIKVLRTINPNVRVIATSGLPDESQTAALELLGVHHFLSKPYDTEMLLDTLRKILASQSAGARPSAWAAVQHSREL